MITITDDDIQKRIPKTLIVTEKMFLCPSCRRNITSRNKKRLDIRYCPRCGQAINWDIVEICRNNEPVSLRFNTNKIELLSVIDPTTNKEVWRV